MGTRSRGLDSLRRKMAEAREERWPEVKRMAEAREERWLEVRRMVSRSFF
jgi:hypothetical protein